MIKVQTYLPVFPGFYGTLFEVDYSFIEEDLRELEQELTEENIYSNIDIKKEIQDFFWKNDDNYTNYKEYENQVVKTCVNAIEKELYDLNIIKSIKLEELVSPKEYNFYNDSVNVEITFTKKHILNIKKIIKENFKEWTEFLKNRYTSRSGFISSYDNYPESEEWQIDFAIKKPHQSGAILEFILMKVNNYTSESLYYACSDELYYFMDIDKFEKDIRKVLNEKSMFSANRLQELTKLLDEHKSELIIKDNSIFIPSINFKCSGELVNKYLNS